MDVEPLHSATARLRPWREEDAEWYVASRDELIFRWTTERRDLTVEDVHAAIRRVHDSPDIAAFAIEDANGRLAGNLAIAIDEETAEISYFLAADARGSGIATAAVALALSWLAGHGIRRVTAQVAEGNQASASVLLRNGFVVAESAHHDQLGAVTRFVLPVGDGGRA